MTIWLDNHLSPDLALWLQEALGEPCLQIRNLGLARTADSEIFAQARSGARILLTKDRDFADLVVRLGPPPTIVLLGFGNTSTRQIKDRYGAVLLDVLRDADPREPLIEIGRR